MKKSAEQMIDEIMEYFDFDKVQKTMELLDWKWASERVLKVPNTEEIKKTAKMLLKDVVDGLNRPEINHRDRYVSATGGLHASGYKTKKGNISQLELEFIVADWEANRDSDE